MKRPTIAIDTTYMDRRPAMGTAVFVRKLVEYLEPYKDEFDITLVHREPIPEDPLYTKYTEVIMPKIHLPKGSRKVSELLFFLRRKKIYDIYYFAYSKLPPYFFLAPARYIISMQYDGGPMTTGFNLPHTVDKTPKWMPYLMRRYGSAFIATSQFGKKGLIEARGLPPDKIHILYGGAEPIFRPIPKIEAQAYVEKEYGFSKDRPLIIASGRLDPHKNAYRLVEAYDILKKKYNIPHRLIITGGIHIPEYSAKVLKLIEERGLQEDVFVLKIRGFDEMPYFYNAAEVMVFPSLYEGFGLPLVEVMQCGTPTVAARSSSLVEVGGGATEFVDPMQPDDIARGIYKVLSDHAYQKELIEKGFIQAKKFTWEKHAERFAALVKDLLREKAQ